MIITAIVSFNLLKELKYSDLTWILPDLWSAMRGELIASLPIAGSCRVICKWLNIFGLLAIRFLCRFHKGRGGRVTYAES